MLSTSCVYSLPSNLGVITLPLGKISPQACLASTTGLPSPLRNYVFANNQQGHPHLSSFILDSEASGTRNNSALVRCAIPIIVPNRNWDRHHPTLEVLGFLRTDSGELIQTSIR